jgi:hypothetical protein
LSVEFEIADSAMVDEQERQSVMLDLLMEKDYRIKGSKWRVQLNDADPLSSGG